jgi:hypothetical protein
MLEPAAEGGGVSDFAVLFAHHTRGTTTQTQEFDLWFLSDGAFNFDIQIIGNVSGFDAALAAYTELVEHGVIKELVSPFPENGCLQNLFCFDGLKVNAASDAVPLPPSAILFGTGLLGLAPVWRMRRKACNLPSEPVPFPGVKDDTTPSFPRKVLL